LIKRKRSVEPNDLWRMIMKDRESVSAITLPFPKQKAPIDKMEHLQCPCMGHVLQSLNRPWPLRDEKSLCNSGLKLGCSNSHLGNLFAEEYEVKWEETGI
jgi:predicted metalloenzyme YecM